MSPSHHHLYTTAPLFPLQAVKQTQKACDELNGTEKGEDLESIQSSWEACKPPLLQSPDSVCTLTLPSAPAVPSPSHQRILEVHEPAVIQREPALLESLSLLRREEVTCVRGQCPLLRAVRMDTPNPSQPPEANPCLNSNLLLALSELRVGVRIRLFSPSCCPQLLTFR